MVLLHGFMQHNVVEQGFNAIVTLFPWVLCDEKVNGTLFQALCVSLYHVVTKKVIALQSMLQDIFSQDMCTGGKSNTMPDIRMAGKHFVNLGVIMFLLADL